MFKALTSLCIMASLAACASLEPEPCTSEWVEWKTERVLTGFARSNYGDIRKLKAFSETLAEGSPGPLTAMKIPGMLDTFKDLAVSFEKRVMPDLNAAIAQCGDPQTLIPAFTAFLRKEGVEEDVLEWVSFLGAFIVET